MTYTLGMDAGGTKTECALALDGAVVARVSGGSIKVMRVSDAEAEANLGKILDATVASAGVDLGNVVCTCVGLAGVTVPQVADWVRTALRARVGGKIILCGDEDAALDAAFHGGPGVVVVAGTGSNLVARTSAGRWIRVGGWGPALSDEGSGHWIGQEAVRAILDAADRDDLTLTAASEIKDISAGAGALVNLVERAWNLHDRGLAGVSRLTRLVDWVNRQPPPDYSQLAPLVAEYAAQGNHEARRVLERAGAELGRLVGIAVTRMMAAESTPVELPEVAYSGSVLRKIAPVREAMFATIRRRFPGIRLRENPVDPVEGALWRASVEVASSRE